MLKLFFFINLIQSVNYQIPQRIQIQSQKEYLRTVSSEEVLEFRDHENVRHVYLFSNPHCLWCKEAEDDLIKMSKELTEVEFYKINCQKEKEYCKQMNVHHVPTIYVFKNYVQRKCFDNEYNYLKKFIMKI